MRGMYDDNLLDHYKYPRNKGSLESPTKTITETNASCGDKLTFDFLINNGKISDIRFDGVGCAISQACSSIISEHVKGKSILSVKKMSEKEFLKIIGVPITNARMKCALLSFKILQEL